MSHRVQGSDAWHEWRRTHVTASRISAIMGEDPWSTPMDVYKEMVEGTRKEPTESMKRGILMEPHARASYEALTGLAVDPLVVEHAKHNWMGASLDGITFDNKIIVEIKCPGKETFEKIKREGIPRHYWIQMQAQMFCCPTATKGHFFAFTEYDHYLETVYPDPFFHEQMLEKCEAFLECLVNKTPPAAKYEQIDDPNFFELEDNLQKIMEIKKRIEKAEESLKEQLLELSQGKQVEGNLVRISNNCRKGALDERKMKDAGIDVDSFRKPSKTYRCVTFIKGKDRE